MYVKPQSTSNRRQEMNRIQNAVAIIVYLLFALDLPLLIQGHKSSHSANRRHHYHDDNDIHNSHDSDSHHDHSSHGDHHHHPEGTFCGMKDPTIEEKMEDMVRVQAYRRVASRRRLQPITCEELCDQCIDVPINLHLLMIPIRFSDALIPHPTNIYNRWNNGKSVDMDDFSTQEDIEKLFLANLELLNKAYEGTPFRFSLKKVTQVKNRDWALNAEPNYRQMSAEVGTSDPKEMDVFLSLQMTDTGEYFLGMATNAASQAVQDGDGVFMRYDVLLNGGMKGNEKGYILVHEAGHWLGLWHTFQEPFPFLDEDTDPCDPNLPGDFVDDTPIHSGPSADDFDCMDFLDKPENKLPDSCPDQEGKDPIFNFLNYVWDERCWQRRGNFTCQQKERMWLAYKLHREYVTTCEEGEMEVELSVTLVEGFDDVSMVLTDQDGNVYFDSVRDHKQAALEVYATSLLTDLCVPNSNTYSFDITDAAGNGFSEGSLLSLFVDRQLVHRVGGNFGEKRSLTFKFTRLPINFPSFEASSAPTPAVIHESSSGPTKQSTPEPTLEPTTEPSASPIRTTVPSTSPPTAEPSANPSAIPTASPTIYPTISLIPSTIPTVLPSINPTISIVPSAIPTVLPTIHPTISLVPSDVPSFGPSSLPSTSPSLLPSADPSESLSPSSTPSKTPTLAPSGSPSLSTAPSMAPTLAPTTAGPTEMPTGTPTARLRSNVFTENTEKRTSGSVPCVRYVPGIMLTMTLLLLFT